MYMDAQARPSLTQAVTTGTQLSTDSIDLLSANDNPGRSSLPLRAVVVCTTTFTGGTSLQVNLIQSANSDLSSGTVVATGAVIVEASLTSGAKLLDVPLPDISAQYIGFQFVTVGTHTAGKVTGGIVAGTDRTSAVLPMNTGL